MDKIKSSIGCENFFYENELLIKSRNDSINNFQLSKLSEKIKKLKMKSICILIYKLDINTINRVINNKSINICYIKDEEEYEEEDQEYINVNKVLYIL